ncbi:hypothetical protein LPJ53_004230 [Coemansia erecta]|uniref:BHLH domain-containing protein n=1 Tax=Coemansia erecta TaxID=147472 RepID=A0A9W8CQ04_9FUNG|nr:hypothetical protein LPJ53_004230 [Coemansia erecta]
MNSQNGPNNHSECTNQDDQLSGEWVQSFMSQMPITSFSTMPQPIGIRSITELSGGSIDISKAPMMHTTTASSDSDSDEFNKSLSYLLTKHLSDQSSGSSDHNSGLNSIFSMSYDGSRQIISMPSPLDNLSLDIPINPPTQFVSRVGMLDGSQESAGKQAMYESPHPANVFNVGALPTRPTTSESLSSIFGLSHHVPMCVTPNQAHQAPTAPISNPLYAPRPTGANSRTALGISVATHSGLATPTAQLEKAAKRSISMLSPEHKPRRGRPSLGSKRSASTGKYLKPIKPTDQQHPNLLQASSVSDPLLEDTTALADSTSSIAIPHRVDRQLAAAARPLLFVRPTDINDKPRRRKRRCVSKDTALATDPAATPASSDEALATTLAETDKDAAENHNSVQWQRISEQRRRDAMRESFDLLKRMLPQSYMTSDDGRELARPVLLARFLRWVDDTLIEMEGLKVEVSRLRIGTRESSNQQQ